MSSRIQQGVAVGVFHDRTAAERAVNELHAQGFTPEQIGFAVRGTNPTELGPTPSDTSATAPDGTGPDLAKGAVTGTVVGGILGGLATVIIPGVGPIIAAGILGATVAGAAVGAAAGAFVASLVNIGVPEEEARFYQREVEQGRAVVTVLAGTRVEPAEETLRRFGAEYVGHPVVGTDSLQPRGETT